MVAPEHFLVECWWLEEPEVLAQLTQHLGCLLIPRTAHVRSLGVGLPLHKSVLLIRHLGFWASRKLVGAQRSSMG